MNKLLAKESRALKRHKTPSEIFCLVNELLPSEGTSLDTAEPTTDEEINSVRTAIGPEFDSQLRDVLRTYRSVCEPLTDLPPSRPGFDFEINLTGVPPKQRQNRLSPAQFQEVQRQTRKQLEQGLIEPSSSSFAAPTKEEHIEHIKAVLALLKEHQLHLRLKKCKFGQYELKYLGFIVGGGYVRTDPDKIAPVRDWPRPTTQKQLKSFVQFCSFHRKFVPKFADMSAPLTDCLRKNQPVIVDWSGSLGARRLGSFEALKKCLISAPALVIPDTGSDATFRVTSDASDVGVSAVLEQEQGTGWQPVEFFARKLTPGEQDYSPYDLESLAAVAAVKHWNHYLDGCKSFELHTDHCPLTHLLTQPAAKLNKRQMGYIRDLQSYASHMKICYIKGEHNRADALSRRPDFFGASLWPGVGTSDCHIVQIIPPDENDMNIDESDSNIMCCMVEITPDFMLALEGEESVDTDVLQRIKSAYE
eukprot:scaffold237718_cov33-Prasinocladus_malaysianus.AAC.1